jgi:hypothetical protein
MWGLIITDNPIGLEVQRTTAALASSHPDQLRGDLRERVQP